MTFRQKSSIISRRSILPMNIPAFLRQHAGLTGLVIILVVAFLLKNAEKSVLIVDQTNQLGTLTTPAPPKVLQGDLKPQKATTSRVVSSANAAASISHAIQASLRPKVKPLPTFADITDIKTKKNSFFKYMTALSETANYKVVQIRREIKGMQPQKISQQQLKTPKPQNPTFLEKIYFRIEILIYLTLSVAARQLLLALTFMAALGSYQSTSFLKPHIGSQHTEVMMPTLSRNSVSKLDTWKSVLKK